METPTDRAPTGAERYLEAAIDLFGEHGFRATPRKAIAARAGASHNR